MWTEVLWSGWLTQHGWSGEQIAHYLDHDRFAYGVGFTAKGARAEPHNAYETGVTWLYRPTPRGVTLHQTKHSGISNFLWGGQAGGTKSYTLRWEAIRECLFTTYEDYRAIIVRRELEELRRTHLDAIDLEARKICEALGNDKAIKVTTQPPLVRFELSGAKIIFGHCLNAGDENKYLSEYYDLFGGDEATMLLWKQIVGIQGRVRQDTKTGRIGRMLLTTNPGGPSHVECVEHFMTKTGPRVAMNKKYRPENYQFVASRLADNPYYMDADGTFATYETRLWMYEEARRKQLLEGDWSVVEGQFFGSFNPDQHVRAA